MESEAWSVREAICKALHDKLSSWSEAIGSILAETLGMDSIGSFRASRMTVNRILKKSVALGVEIRA